MEDHVKALVKKAAEANSPHEAMHYSQAALNAAHAFQVLKTLERHGT